MKPDRPTFDPAAPGRTGCPREFELIQACAGEGDPAANERALAHAEGCAACQAILSLQRALAEELLRAHPFEQLERQPPKPARPAWGWRLAAAGALLLLVALGAVWLWPGEGAEKGGIRTKGTIDLGFYVLRGDRAVPGTSGATLHKDDRIQFTYSSGPHPYLFLISIDDRGRVSNFNYRENPQSLRIPPGEQRLLEGSIILDEATGPERIYAIFSDRPLSFGEVQAEAARAWNEAHSRGASISKLEQLPLPYPQASILLIKE